MNIEEGVRRLALLVGALGATLGCLASYSVSRDALEARARHRAFELLATSDVVRQERSSWTLTLRYTPDKAIETLRKLPENQQRDVLVHLSQDERADLAARLRCGALSPGSPTATTLENLSHVDSNAGHQHAKDDPFACIAEPIDPPTSSVNKGGIKAIHWTRILGIESIEREDGATLYPTPRPTLRPFLLAAALPVLGFAVPWGSFRALGWVAAGFHEKAK